MKLDLWFANSCLKSTQKFTMLGPPQLLATPHFHALAKTSQIRFSPHFCVSWNKLENDVKSEHDISIFKEKLKVKLKPKRFKHFSRGSKRGNSLLTQLRVGRSYLGQHSFTIGLSESPDCLCHRVESTEHYLIDCFLYNEERRILFDSVEQLVPKFKNLTKKKKVEILLNGINNTCDEIDSRNVPLMLSIQNYILNTKRFQSF